MRPLDKRARRTRARGLARARYAAYMDSPAWWHRRHEWTSRWLAAHPGEQPSCVVCEHPWSERRGDLHHRTYARLGAEQDSDLIPMCRRCHDRLHDVIDASPGWRRADRRVATDIIVEQMRTRIAASRSESMPS